MDRTQRDEEEREQQLLNEQIERAKKVAEERGNATEQQATELKREEGEKSKIKLNMSMKPMAKPTVPTTSKAGGNKMRMMMKSGGIKKPNPPRHLTMTTKSSQR